MKKFISEFKAFALKGNVMDLAVGVIIGGAFNSIVTSLVNNVIMPIISLVTGKVDFTNMFINLNPESTAKTLAEAQEAGDAVIAYGSFITAIINFIILALVVFMMVKALNKLTKKDAPKAPAAPTTKKCPYCLSDIPIAATRCPHCTSEVPADAK